MKVKVDSKKCGVCGDKALGYNFNAVTCESCKAFFRRNALLQKEFKCPFDNRCEITQVTRRFCQKCRLDKCFNIGMCKDLIMSEQDKVLKRQKIEENRAKKRSIDGFKSGFKKIKKERNSTDAESQETDSFNGAFTDSDSKETVMSDQGYQPNNQNVGVINYTKLDNSVASPNDCLVSSSDDIRKIMSTGTELNTQTSKLVEKEPSEVENHLLDNLVNNNDLNCNNNSENNQTSVADSKHRLDVTKDVVEDVQR